MNNSELKTVYVSYTEGDDDFMIVGEDYKEVLKHLCLFLNDQENFPYRFSLKLSDAQRWVSDKTAEVQS
jgi:hypothetical protein